MSEIAVAEPEVQQFTSPRRLGRFSVPAHLFVRWEALLPLMAQMVVLATGGRGDTIEFIAFSPHFREITRTGEEVPAYDLRCERGEDGEMTFSMREHQDDQS